MLCDDEWATNLMVEDGESNPVKDVREAIAEYQSNERKLEYGGPKFILMGPRFYEVLFMYIKGKIKQAEEAMNLPDLKKWRGLMKLKHIRGLPDTYEPHDAIHGYNIILVPLMHDNMTVIPYAWGAMQAISNGVML